MLYCLSSWSSWICRTCKTNRDLFERRSKWRSVIDRNLLVMFLLPRGRALDFNNLVTFPSAAASGQVNKMSAGDGHRGQRFKPVRRLRASRRPVWSANMSVSRRSVRNQQWHLEQRSVGCQEAMTRLFGLNINCVSVGSEDLIRCVRPEVQSSWGWTELAIFQ